MEKDIKNLYEELNAFLSQLDNFNPENEEELRLKQGVLRALGLALDHMDEVLM